MNQQLRKIEDVMLPNLLRMQWVSNEARNLWEPILEKAVEANVCCLMERLKSGHCEVGIIKTKPSNWFKMKQELLKQGFYFKLAPAREISGLFLKEAPCKYLSNADAEFYFVAVVKGHIDFLEEMMADNDVAGIKFMLGLSDREPELPIENDRVLGMLLATYTHEKQVDAHENWFIDIAQNEYGLLAKGLVMSYLGAGLIWRYDRPLLGAASIREWKEIDSTLRDEYKEVYINLMHLLNLPIEVSSYHGIVEVKTPVMKFITNSDALQTKVVIRMHHNGEQVEKGAKGLRFPYKIK